MDQPSRPSDAPKLSRRRATTPVISEKPQSPVVPPSGSSSTALPSIRQLHPHLPPPTPFFAPSDVPGYAPAPQHGGSEPGPSELHPIAEESDSDKEVSAPPKKRRKRQALSCTECKRRKIRCDRNQPCGPCTRRNEAQKCQWHQVESNDKYVTRVEYDQLKTRVDRLESLVARLTGTLPSMHTHAITSPNMSTAAGPIPAYTHPYRPPSVLSGSYHSGAEPHAEPYLRRMPSVPSSSHKPILGGLTSPPLNRDTFPAVSRMQPPAQTPHAIRQLPPSLAAITTPFDLNPDDGSKKRSAQMFIWLGERLRQLFQAYGPALLLFNLIPNHQLPIQLLSPQLFIVTLLCLLAVIVHLVIPLRLYLFPSVFGTPKEISIHLHPNAIVDPTTRQAPVGRPGGLL